MADFYSINENHYVVNIVHVDDDVCTDEDENFNPELGIRYLTNVFGGLWAYHEPQEVVNEPDDWDNIYQEEDGILIYEELPELIGVGYKYNPETNEFSPGKPGDDYVWDFVDGVWRVSTEPKPLPYYSDTV